MRVLISVLGKGFDKYKEVDQLQCVKFPALLAECWYSEETPCKGSGDKRNFFAHAGFERCAVEVHKDEMGTIYFRFAEATLGQVQKFLTQPAG